MAQFAVLVHAGDSAHAPGDEGPAEQVCDGHSDDLAPQGSMTGAWALTPRGSARSIRASGVTEGPFLDAAEVVAGCYLVGAPSLGAALAVAARNPVVAAGGGVEVRPVHSGGWVDRPGT